MIHPSGCGKPAHVWCSIPEKGKSMSTRRQFLQREIAFVEEQIETARRLGDRQDVEDLTFRLDLLRGKLLIFDNPKEEA